MQTNLRHRSLLWVLGAAMLLLLAACGAQDEPTPTFDLSVTVQGDGNVTSDPAGIDVDAGDTSAAFDEGTDVTLTATAGAGSAFDAWTGDCDSTSANTCTVGMDAAKSVTATFMVDTTPTNTLEVTVVGEGAVTSDPAGIDTDQVDGTTHDFAAGTDVTLTATAGGTEHAFDGWTGDCDTTSANTCTVGMDAAKFVTAEFVQTSGTVTATISTGSDDAEELVNGSTQNPGTFPAGHTYTHSSDLELTYDDGSNSGAQLIGLRFQNIQVPAGATITSATITFTADGNSEGALTAPIVIAGQAEAQPATFNDDDDSTASSNISTRPLTTTVNWSPPNWTGAEVYSTSDLAPIVQAIVDLAAWESGFPMAFIFDGPDGAPLRRAFAYEYDSQGTIPAGTYAPGLTIEWELPQAQP